MRFSISAALTVALICAFAVVLKPGVGFAAGPFRVGWFPSPTVQDRPVEQQIQRSARDLLRGIRRSVRRAYFMVSNGPRWWLQRAKRAVLPLGFAVAVLLLDPALLAAWKRDGLKILGTYAPLMLYVYGGLFFSGNSIALARLFVLTTLVYGVWRDDVFRDGPWLSPRGRIEDFVLIGISVRYFVSTCPEHLVRRHARQAIEVRRRLTDAWSSRRA